jgi:hypothetical protein
MAAFGANQPSMRMAHETRSEIDDGAFGSEIVLGCLAQGSRERPDQG